MREAVAFFLPITTSSSSQVFLPPFFTVYVINTSFPQWVAVKGGAGVWRLEKEQNNVFFHQKFPLFPYLKVSSSEPLERQATIWPHSEHLVTIWNTLAVNWRRRRWEKRSLVLFMILGLVAIWVPPFMSTLWYGPLMRGGLSAALESYSLLPSASLYSSLAGFEEEK